ncbi:MAG: hypothetical protein INR71_00710 [Terriglobus roseus]|nr:hypothetical protein [Terriglobus roseus]
MKHFSRLLCCLDDDAPQSATSTKVEHELKKLRLHRARSEKQPQPNTVSTPAQDSRPQAAKSPSPHLTRDTSLPLTPPTTPPLHTAADMPPHTTAQRNAIAEFINFTKADKTSASRVRASFPPSPHPRLLQAPTRAHADAPAQYLKSSDWNVQSAVNAYFNDGPASQASSGARAELGKLFDRYRDDAKQSPNTIGMDGTQRYCADIDVSVEDIGFFILSEVVQSTSMGEMEREPFVSGWAEVR